MKQDIIYFTTMDMGWEVNWKPLTFCGNTFTDINEAKKFVRANKPDFYIGLATQDQMLMNNAQWDNI